METTHIAISSVLYSSTSYSTQLIYRVYIVSLYAYTVHSLYVGHVNVQE